MFTKKLQDQGSSPCISTRTNKPALYVRACFIQRMSDEPSS
jgi:hypothetical protein